MASACASNGMKGAAAAETSEPTTGAVVVDGGVPGAFADDAGGAADAARAAEPDDAQDVGADAATSTPTFTPTPTPTASLPAPMSLISVKRPVVTSAGGGAVLVDDSYFDLAFWDVPAASQPFAAIDLGTGPSRLFVEVYASQADTIPRGYRLETSADARAGRDGTWTERVRVADNAFASRAHLVDFTGQRWLRIVITEAAPGASGQVRLNEIGVRDASRGASDGWIFVGDSITAITMHPGPAGFAGRVHAAHAAYYPLAVNAGIGGTRTVDGLQTLDAMLAAYPDVQNWVVGYGTNDAASGDAAQAAVFGRNLRTLVERLKQAGKTPFVPRIPYRDGPDVTPFNRVLDQVVASTGAVAGPDLYAYFSAHRDELYDGVHPDARGAAAMIRLWAEAVSPRYR